MIYYDDVAAKSRDWLRQTGVINEGKVLLLFSCPDCERFFAKMEQQHFPALSDDQILLLAHQAHADVLVENGRLISAALPEQRCILCSLQKLGGMFTAQSCYLAGQHLGYRFDWEKPDEMEQIICFVSTHPVSALDLLQAYTTEVLSPTRYVREVLEVIARRASPRGCCRVCTLAEFELFKHRLLTPTFSLANGYVFRLEQQTLLLAGSEPPFELLDRFRLLALCMSKELP